MKSMPHCLYRPRSGFLCALLEPQHHMPAQRCLHLIRITRSGLLLFALMENAVLLHQLCNHPFSFSPVSKSSRVDIGIRIIDQSSSTFPIISRPYTPYTDRSSLLFVVLLRNRTSFWRVSHINPLPCQKCVPNALQIKALFAPNA